MLLIFLIRLILMTQISNLVYHADENWQAIEIAYDLIFGKKSGSSHVSDVILSWEWYDMYTLRSHFYPLLLSLPGQVLKRMPLGEW